MDNLFQNLFDAVENLNSHLNGTIDEIRASKVALSKERTDMYNRFSSGYYLRDENRIVISAPEIIIGNVDKSGCVQPDSTIILRGNAIKLQGVGDTGVINASAANVSIAAEDAGPDGMESVVHPTSSVSILGRQVAIESNSSTDTFSHRLLAATAGLSLHSDTTISVDASLQRDRIEGDLDQSLAAINAEIGRLNAAVGAQKAALTAKLASVNALIATEDPLHLDENTTYISALLIDNLSENLVTQAKEFLADFNAYLNNVTALIENTRRKAALQAQRDALPNANDFSDKSNNCNVKITGERIDLDCRDGNGKVRKSADSGVTINSPHTTITSTGDDNRNIPDSDFTLRTRQITLDTANIKDADKNKAANEERTFESDGCVKIISKDVSVTAFDYKKTEQNPCLRDKQCPEGSLTIGVKKILASTADDKGDAAGEIKLNSKAITLEGATLDPQNGTEKKVAEGTQVTVLSDSVLIGGSTNDNKTSAIQMLAKKSILQGEDRALVYQGAVDKVSAALDLTGSKAAIAGETTLHGKTTTHEMSIDDLTVKKITATEGAFSGKLKTPKSEWGDSSASVGKATEYSAKPEIQKVEFSKTGNTNSNTN